MTPTSPDLVLVLCTVPASDDSADRLVDTLLEESLIACANIVGPMRSRYVWEGRIETGEELLLLMKTLRSRLVELRSRIVELHDYAVPEVLELDLAGGHPGYLDWVAAACGRSSDA